MADREKNKEAQRRWRARNPDKVKVANKAHYDANRDYHLAKANQWYKDNPERSAANNRRSKIQRKYGITVEEADTLLSEQGGRCAICRSDDVSRRSLDIDHCHTSGTVRGILCSPCNRMLGYARDNPELLIAASTYLRGA